MAAFQPPPTWAEVIVYDEERKKGSFNPVWLKWFIDLVGFLNAAGGSNPSAHNNLTGLQGGTANQFYHLTAAEQAIASLMAAGTYTPTLTKVANLDGTPGAYQAQYLRVGATVMVTGRVDVDPPAGAALTQLGISLPVVSNFGAIEDCAGAAAASGIAGQSAAIVADTVNDRAQMQWISGDVTNQPMYFTFGYQVI